MTRDFGRHVYGVAAILLAGVTLHWHSYNQFVVYLVTATALTGGALIQFRQTAPLGAKILGVLYCILAVRFLPNIVKAPLIYNSWGNFFEQASFVTGALIAYGSHASGTSLWAARAAKLGRILFGICVVSFTLEQGFYLHETANFVPKWMPLGRMFWALVTTVFFALAAIAILSGRQALLAARLLTAMILGFGFLIWFPALFADPRSHVNWAENFVNLAVAGVAWILADYLRRTKP